MQFSEKPIVIAGELSNTSQIFFAVNDPQTADMISTRLGDSTIIVNSGGSGTSNSHQTGGNNFPTSTHGNNSNWNWAQQARRLLKPEEVIGLHPRLAITFTPGVPPICTVLTRYYEEPVIGKRTTWLSRTLPASRMLLGSSLLCGLSIFLAYGATLVATSTLNQSSYTSIRLGVPVSHSSP